MHNHTIDIIRSISKAGIKIIFYTNATMMGQQVIDTLTDINATVQVSLEGFELIHDSIRGAGCFTKSICAVRQMLKRGLRVNINTQVTDSNYESIDSWIHYLYGIGVNEVILSVVGSIGNAKTNSISTSQKALDKLRNICMHSGSNLWKCSALTGKLAVNYDGIVYPCDFFKAIGQFSLGNIYSKSLLDIWDEWKGTTNVITDYNATPNLECMNCSSRSSCRKCIARVYGLYKNLNHPDPIACYLYKERPSQVKSISTITAGTPA